MNYVLVKVGKEKDGCAVLRLYWIVFVFCTYIINYAHILLSMTPASCAAVFLDLKDKVSVSCPGCASVLVLPILLYNLTPSWMHERS